MTTAKFSEIRDQIKPGNILALHDEFVASWYGLKIWGVQQFTGKYCHVGLLDVIDGDVRVIESVIPLIRNVALKDTAAKGFFWIPMHKPLNDISRAFAYSKVGLGGYSQLEAVEAGVNMYLQKGLPDDNQRDHLWECARFVRAVMLKNNVYLGEYDVPTKIVEACQIGYKAEVIEVTMD